MKNIDPRGLEPRGTAPELDSVSTSPQYAVQRRDFLATAVALGVLSLPTNGKTPALEEIVENRNVTDKGTYSVTDCGSVPGGLNNVHIRADMNDRPLEIEGVHEENGWSGVGLRWSSGPVEVGTTFVPNDARDLAARLVVAADAAEGNFDD